ncbi:MAG: OmpA family protein [Pseudomonadota bacterium]
MKAIFKLCAGLFAVVLIGSAALFLENVPGSAGSVEQKLADGVQTAIGVEAASTTNVEIDGQKAILTGAAPSAQERDQIVERVTRSSGAGGMMLGGVTAIDASGLSVSPQAPIASPFTFSAERGDVALSFSGYVPDQETRDTLFTLARELMPQITVAGDLDVARGAPVEADAWASAATASLRALSYLRSGAIAAEDTLFTLSGEAENETRATAARALVEDMSAGLTGAAEITILTPPESMEDLITRALEDDEQALASSDEMGVSETAPINAEAAGPPACVATLQSYIDSRRIGFLSARADIDNPSRNQLRQIAAALNNCPRTRLEITGHTDSSGNPARNRQLSGYRADAVRAFLISVGAPAGRLSARGVGASEPLTSNATPAGRERNRRIDIEIVSAE